MPLETAPGRGAAGGRTAHRSAASIIKDLYFVSLAYKESSVERVLVSACAYARA